MQRYTKILTYKIIYKCLCIFLLLILKVLSVYSINTDSLLNISLQNANFEGALKLVDQCRKQAVTKERNATLLLKTVDIYLRLGKADAAKSAMDEAEALFSKISYPSAELEFQHALQKGRYFAFTGNQADELIWLHRAEKQINYLNGNDPDDVSRLYGELGSYYDDLSDYPAAIRYYQLAANRQKTDRVYGKIMQIYYNACLANDFWTRNETDKAVGLITPCLDYLDSTTDPYHPALLEVYFNVARYCINANNDYTTAEELLVKATRIMNKFFPPDHYLIGKLYFSKSQIEYAKSDYERALFFSLQVQKISDKYPVLIGYQVQNYYKLAAIYYWYKHDYKKAIELCRLGLGNNKRFGLSFVYYLYLTGISYLRMSEIPLGMDYLGKAVRISSESSSPSELGICASANYEMSRIASSEKNISMIFHYLNEAIRTSKKISDRNTQLAKFYNELGRAYFLNTNDYRAMLNSVQLSIISGCKTFSDTMITANPPLHDIVAAYPLIVSFMFKAYGLYLLYEKQPDKLNYLELALECQELSVKLYERTLIDIKDENSGLHLADVYVDDLNNAVSYSTLLYLKTKDRQYAEKALEYAEKSKMQVMLIKTLKENDLRHSGLPDSIINKEEKLTHDIFEIESQLALDEKGGSLSAINGPVLMKLTGFYDQRDELINQMREDYPVYYRAKYSFNLAGIKDIQRILDDDQVILEYQLLKTEIIIFVISRNDFNIHYQLIDKQVPEHIRQLRSALASNPGSKESAILYKAFTGSSFYLYQKLIEPVYGLIRNKRLIIIPHNDLTLIPFEVLISAKPENIPGSDYKSLHYLIKEFPIAYAYSANLLLDNNQGKDFGRGTAVFLPDYKSYIQNKTFPICFLSCRELLQKLPVLSNYHMVRYWVKNRPAKLLLNQKHINTGFCILLRTPLLMIRIPCYPAW